MTKYLIMQDSVNGTIYVKAHPSGFHWTTEKEQAKRFDSMSGAIGHATMHCNLSPKEYDIELVKE
jgi:hypothetical protein